MRQAQTTGRQVTRETPDPEPPTPATVALPVPTAPCPSCDGAGVRRMSTGGGLADWVTISCRSCRPQRAAA
jgi:hypothetical protein